MKTCIYTYINIYIFMCFSFLCSLLMPYWTSLCLLRRICRQSSLYETLSHCNILSKHHYHHVSWSTISGEETRFFFIYIYINICICISICTYLYLYITYIRIDIYVYISMSTNIYTIRNSNLLYYIYFYIYIYYI
jgi:hypothetical protein